MDKEEPSVTEEKQSNTRLVDVEVPDENVALNLLVGFVSIAQRRGVFSMEESSKIWEC